MIEPAGLEVVSGNHVEAVIVTADRPDRDSPSRIDIAGDFPGIVKSSATQIEVHQIGLVQITDD